MYIKFLYKNKKEQKHLSSQILINVSIKLKS